MGLCVEIEFQLTEKDLAAFADYQVQNSASVRATVRRSRIAYGVGFLILAAGFWLSDDRSPVPAAFLIIGLFLVAMAPALHRRRLRTHFARSYRDPANRMKYGRRKLRITDDALEDTSDASQSVVKWAAVVKVDQTPSHGFVYLASDSALVIPREAVGAEAFQAFMARASALWRGAAA